ncbi:MULTISPECIES: helix-turn-helix domain-containing protein [Actinoalloteichus]|uniref:DNA binding protein with helix-turn-helix domain n=1 Tax=Actinoalloteichus fjordicus TaxID=1612552 RepID=A0AAC9LDT9_9PSEU|nr:MULTISPECIES: helix-turn-helix transcriptional regulator [Actinoalloteichus]APU14474.1 DNA binding protein with helix-turn-helix domain [Actinoalloteichus fjordicus]APU20443.1 DNA binding protein with helix-turn-helix domain [Actinoalloteichus sp. GBA129-24]
MAERSDPSALRWLIGAELADYRKQTGLSLSKVAAQVAISKPKLSNMEAGRFQQYPDDVAKVLECYGVSQRDIDRLCALAGRSDERAWWAPWAHVVPDWFRTMIGLEGLATAEFHYEPTVIPGLLQTEDYAQALTEATGFVRADHSERFVSFRLARARRLTDAEPLEFHAVMGEAALGLAVGTPEVRQEQYRHLLKVAELPNVTVQVTRPQRGPHAALVGPFYIFDFELARSIACAELLDGAMYVQDFDQVRTYTMAAESAQQVALSPAESVELIETMTDGG